MRALMRSLAPTGFEDVAALVALYRPGPMAANMHNDYADRKNGRKPVEYLHPDAEAILGDTYGPDDLPGVDDAGRPEVRRLLAGRGRQPPQGVRQEGPGADQARSGRSSWRGARPPGTAQSSAPHCSTSSSRSPTTRSTRATATATGCVAYQTAYLKANYPVEYFAALLTSVKTNLDKAAVYLNECRQMGIEVLVPDVNGSMSDFVAVAGDGSDGVGGNGSIPFGLSAVRNVGEGLVGLIVERARGQRAVRRLLRLLRAGRPRGAQQADDRVADQGRRLRLAGPSPPGPAHGVRADHRHHRRPAPQGGRGRMSTVLDEVGDASARRPPRRRPGGPSRAVEFEKKERLGFEKEMLGLYVSDHPLMGAEASLRRRTECTIAELEGVEDGNMRVVGGRGHRPAAQVDEEGRPHGRLHPRGPAGVDRGHGLPEDDAASATSWPTTPSSS